MTFDLEAARAGIAHYRIENPSNVDTESHLKDLVDQANLAEEYLAEIERLRPFEIAARDLDSDLTKIAGEPDDQAARIKELEAQLTITNVALENATRKPNVVYITGTGELGPDADAKPHCWQITEERKAALGQCIFELEDIMSDRPFFSEELAVLRAMLEARQE